MKEPQEGSLHRVPVSLTPEFTSSVGPPWVLIRFLDCRDTRVTMTFSSRVGNLVFIGFLQARNNQGNNLVLARELNYYRRFSSFGR